MNCPKCKGRGVLGSGLGTYCDLCRGRGHLSPFKDREGYALAKAGIHDRSGEEGKISPYWADLDKRKRGKKTHDSLQGL